MTRKKETREDRLARIWLSHALRLQRRAKKCDLPLFLAQAHRLDRALFAALMVEEMRRKGLRQ
jgi:hypothetical protein